MKSVLKIFVLFVATVFLGCSPDSVDEVPAHIRSVVVVAERAMQYEQQHGQYPLTLDQIIKFDATTPTSDYWGNEINYEKRDDKFAVWSAGPDKILDTADDVTISLDPPENLIDSNQLNAEMTDGEILKHFSIDETLATKTTVNGKDGIQNEYVLGDQSVIIVRSLVSGVMVTASGTEPEGSFQLGQNGALHIGE